MIVLLSGANEFLLHQTLDALIEKFVGAMGQHGLERVNGEDMQPSDLPSLLQGASLFSPKRLVILRQPAQNKALWEALGDWAERVPKDTTLVIVEPHPDKRTRAYKQLIKHGTLRECAELSEAALIEWLQKTAKQGGGVLLAAGARHLVQQVGSDQLQLWQELQKLLNYQSQITNETIDLLVEPNPQASAFELLDAAFAGKTAQVNALLDRLAQLEDPYKLCGLIISQLHTLAIVKSAGQRSAEVIAKEAGAHPFVVRKTQSLAREISQPQLKDIIAAAATCDRQLKSTGIDPWILLRQCLGKLGAVRG